MTVELAHPSTEPLASRSPTTPAHPRWWFLWTTPGRILTIGVVLSALVIASAFATSTTINDRQQALTTVLDHTEPLSFAAGQLYTTLSVADAAAATAFIAGSEPRDVRQRYEQAITDASVAVTRASSGLTDEPMVQLLGRVNAQLSVYTGLVETARTNNRAGNPVGSSYLSEASSLMQTQMLPDAQRLYEETSTRVDAETTASTRIPGPVILVVLATLLFGAFANRWLARRTRRRVNIGFVAGGLAVLIMLIWVGTALVISTLDSRSAKDTAAESLKTVTSLAITAQQARADETLSLIRRGDEDVRKQSYYQRIDTMQQQLSDYLSRDDAIDKSDLADAEQLLKRWRAADDRINAYIAVGNYQAATQVALGTGEDDSTPAFDRLDDALTKGIEESRNQLRNDILNARRVLSGATVGAAVLSVVGRARGGAGVVAEAERVPVMSACAKKSLAMAFARRSAAVRAAGGCWPAARTGAAAMPTPGVTLAPPTPAGMEELPPSRPRGRRPTRATATAPRACARSPTKAEADAAVADHPQPRPADRRPRHRQQPVQLPRPDHRRDHRFRRRHRRRGRARHLRHPVAGRVPHPVVGRPRHRTAEQPGRRRRQDHDASPVSARSWCNFSTVYLNANQRILAPRDSTISQPSDLSGKRVCVAKGTTSLRPDPADHPAADHRRRW